ncbi:hypothetical protein X798_08185 [Onchocerca flexuosa]|uniref:Uncharacterized protein n=1 Tax=Onchocerca flexuosa TaxID=387005 RepID=A0A238BH88_9BILA|nr:hypothetical protein X798_08185 [Onchocerca flexuosa]
MSQGGKFKMYRLFGNDQAIYSVVFRGEVLEWGNQVDYRRYLAKYGVEQNELLLLLLYVLHFTSHQPFGQAFGQEFLHIVADDMAKSDL